MKALLVGLSLFSAGSLRVCSSEESAPKATASAEAAVAASGSVAAALAPAKARIGGSVVAVGDHSVELLLHQSGSVEALVSNSSGASVSDGIALSLVATAKGQAKENIALDFAAPRARSCKNA